MSFNIAAGIMSSSDSTSLLQHARELHRSGHYEEAEKQVRRFLKPLKKTLGKTSPELIEPNILLGGILLDARKTKAAALCFNSVLKILDEQEPAFLPERSRALAGLGQMYARQGKWTKSWEYFSKAVQNEEKFVSKERPYLIAILAESAIICRHLNDNEQQHALLLRAIQLAEQFIAERTLAVQDVFAPLAMTMVDLAGAESARRLMEKRLAILEEWNDTETAVVLEAALGQIINFYTLIRDDAHSEDVCERLKELLESKESPDPARIMRANLELAAIYHRRRKFMEAEILLQFMLQDLERNFCEDTLLKADVFLLLGKVLRDNHLPEEALVNLDRAVKLRQEVLAEQHPDIAAALHEIGKVYYYQDNWPEAEKAFYQSVNILEECLGPDDLALCSPLTGLALVYYVQRRHDDARRLLERVLAMKERELGNDHQGLIETLAKLAGVYDVLDRPLVARELRDRAERIEMQVLEQR